MRKLLTPCFSIQMMDTMIHSINDNCEIFVDILKKKRQADGLVPSLFQDIKLLALDIVCEAAMGVKMNVQKNPTSKYIATLKE